MVLGLWRTLQCFIFIATFQGIYHPHFTDQDLAQDCVAYNGRDLADPAAFLWLCPTVYDTHASGTQGGNAATVQHILMTGTLVRPLTVGRVGPEWAEEGRGFGEAVIHIRVCAWWPEGLPVEGTSPLHL